MPHDIPYLLLGFVIIVVSAELFTNGIEWLGQRLQLSEGVVGSVLAAVGTAMPETLVPVVAIFFFKGKHGFEVGQGSIAGAPFMLTTLTLAICGATILLASKLGMRSPAITYNKVVLGRDLKIFIRNYALALLATLASPWPLIRYIVAGLLLASYLHYLYQAFTHAGEVGEEPEQLHFDRLAGLGSERLRLILPQIALGIYGIVNGAYIFVDHVQSLAVSLGVPAVVLALIVSPIATELPEQVNCVLWSRTGKDTLALGNIFGSLVFQSCFPIALGVAFTDWHLPPPALIAAGIALTLASAYWYLITNEKLRAQHLLVGAVVYVLTIAGFVIYR